MSSRNAVQDEEMARAEGLPQADASSLALADIVSGKPLRERTRRNVELWAACIAGAIPRASYLETIAAAGFQVEQVRRNDYDFISDRALDACSTYDVQSVSLTAVKAAEPRPAP